MRLARAYDESIAGDERATLFKRVATAVSKYWICKSATWTVGEALECLGGNGYVEESKMPRLYREAPLNSIWEGSGNVTALDVLRAVGREPESVEAVFAEIEAASGADTWFDRAVRELRTELRGRRSAGRGGWPSCWRCACRGRCCCATPRARCPRRS
jgi:putative acyl-CoA dehydrogenase